MLDSRAMIKDAYYERSVPSPRGLRGEIRESAAPGAGPPLRIALISSSSGSRGGGELYLVGLADALAHQGHFVESVLAAHSRMDELGRLLAEFGPVRRIPYQNTYDRRLRSLGSVAARRGIRRLAAEIDRLDVDVVHVNKQNVEDGLDLLLAAEQSGRTTVATVHVTRSMRSLGSLGGGARDLVSRHVLRRLSCPLIAICRSGVADLEKLGVPRDRIRLVWNGVSLAQAADRTAIRESWGCGRDDVVLGCIARIEHQKNPLFVPTLLAQLPRQVRLVWIGDGSLRASLEQSAARLGVGDRLILPGWQQNARSCLPGFDLFVLPSLYEGFPLAILEAMAAGVPCVVSDVDGIAEAVVDGETGFICPPGDTGIWLERIRRYLQAPELRELTGRSALARYQAHFSLEMMAAKTVDVYRQACATRGVRLANCST